MAARKTEVIIEGDDRLSGPLKKADKASKGLFSTLRTSGVAAFAAFTAGIAAATAALTRVFTAVTAAEDATNQLAQAQRNAGTATETSAAEFDAWADSVQKATTTSADQAKELAALALAFAGSNTQAQQAVDVALDLAAATGKQVNESLLQITKTLGGYAGELGEVIPELRSLTKEQLQAGEAVDILQEKFAGAAEAAAEGLGPAVTRLGSTFDAFLAKVVSTGTGTDSLTASIDSLIDTLQDDDTIDTFATALSVVGAIIKADRDQFDLYSTALGRVIELTRIYTGLTAELEEGQVGLEARAKALGRTTQELKNDMAVLVETQKLGIETHRLLGNEASIVESVLVRERKAVTAMNAEFDKMVTDIQRAASEQKAFASAAKETDDALRAQIDSASILGETTSKALLVEMLKISDALIDQKELLGANSDEYVRLERIADEKLQRLAERVESLKNGQGDLTEATKQTTAATNALASSLDSEAAAADRAAAASGRQAAAVRDATSAAQQANALRQPGGLRGTTNTFTDTERTTGFVFGQGSQRFDFPGRTINTIGST